MALSGCHQSRADVRFWPLAVACTRPLLAGCGRFERPLLAGSGHSRMPDFG